MQRGERKTLATWLPALPELSLEGGSDRLQYSQMTIVADVSGVDLNDKPPCPIPRPAAYLPPIDFEGLMRLVHGFIRRADKRSDDGGRGLRALLHTQLFRTAQNSLAIRV